MKVNFTFKYLMRTTELGERPFTDVFMSYGDRNFYSRYLGTLSKSEIRRDCQILEARLKKEGK